VVVPVFGKEQLEHRLSVCLNHLFRKGILTTRQLDLVCSYEELVEPLVDRIVPR
jgi:hypothetical protein